MGENLAVLAFLYDAGGLKAINAGLWGRTPGELALPAGEFTGTILGEEPKIKILLILLSCLYNYSRLCVLGENSNYFT